MNLNKSQQLAEKRLKRFLMDPDEKEIILNAPSGYGKTHLMNHVVANTAEYRKQAHILGTDIPRQMVFAAPTNKAAAIGYGGGTIHKHLQLAPEKNYQTGETRLIQKTPTKIQVMIADEWSCISSDVLAYMHKFVDKIIYTGDGHQLPPVKEAVSPVAKLGADIITLDEPMRQKVDSGLFKMCQHLRTMVDQGKMIKTVLNEDCHFINGSTMAAMLKTNFGPNTNNRVITYTNKKAIAINNYIRKLHGNTGYWADGELVVAKNAAFATSLGGKGAIVECAYNVTDSNPDREEVELDGVWFNVAKNHQQVTNAIKKAIKDKDYHRMFQLKERWLDLRSAYAGTCHSVQGSTYQNVFIDLTDFSKCHDINVLVRLLYVAVSRAKGKVYFYGNATFNLF